MSTINRNRPAVRHGFAYELTTAVMATADTFLRESQRLFRPHGLTAAQYNVLNVLALRPEGMSQRELGDVLVVDRSNVTGLIDRMEKAGWVRRADNPRDRRVYRVTLTAGGQKLWRKVEPLYRDVVAQVTRGMAVGEMTDCTETLSAMAQRATKWTLRKERARQMRRKHPRTASKPALPAKCFERASVFPA